MIFDAFPHFVKGFMRGMRMNRVDSITNVWAHTQEGSGKTFHFHVQRDNSKCGKLWVWGGKKLWERGETK